MGTNKNRKANRKHNKGNKKESWNSIIYHD